MAHVYLPKFHEFLKTTHFLLIALLFYYLGQGQSNTYRYELSLNDSTQVLSGVAKHTFVNTSKGSLSSLMMHLPSRALEYKGSFLQGQLQQFQKADAHFAKPYELGWIEINDLEVNSFMVEPCVDCEFVEIPLEEPLAPLDSIRVSFSFELKMGSTEFNGVGYDGSVYRIADWLPIFSTVDSSGFHNYPLTFYRDVHTSYNRYKVSLELPADMMVATNTQLLDEEELAIIDSLDNILLAKMPKSTELKKLHFEHSGSNLQFFISRDFHVFKMKNGGHLYFSGDEPFHALQVNEVNEQIDQYFKSELGIDKEHDFDLLLLKDKNSEYQSDHLLTLDVPDDLFKFSAELCHARAEQIFRYKMNVDGFKSPWLARGIPYFYKYNFVNEYFPEKKWLPLSNSFIGKFFGLDQFDYAFQNQFFYLYLARQNFDQKMSTSADSLSRLNYEAIAQAKTYLALGHLRGYTSLSTFKRSMRRYMLEYSRNPNAENLRKSFTYYCNRDVDWFFKTWINTNEVYEYRLVEADHCPTVSTATVVNKGTLVLPFSLTGFKDGKPVLTEWHDGHTGKKSVQMHHDEYDKVVLNYPGIVPEYNQKNNTYYDRLLFQRFEPLRLQFYYSFEDPNKSQLYWTPTVNFNAYDKVLLGVSLDNSSIVQKPFEYVIGPEYSTGTGKLTGYASTLYNLTTRKSRLFHQIRLGVFARYYHYDRDLAYTRISPTLKFYFKKPYATSPVIQSLRLRMVHLDRELPPDFDEPQNGLNTSSYSVFNITHQYENTSILSPFSIVSDFYLGDEFSRISLEGDFRRMLWNKKWLIWRNYIGVFLVNTFADNGVNGNYYSLGLSGTQDFMFDYNLYGRSETSGIWSQQFFVTDGGFKSQTGVLSDRWMFSTNLTVPIWSIFGVFADVAALDDGSKLYYDAGIRIALVTDFLEIYFPLVNQDTNFLTQKEYYTSIRFVLDIDQGNIIERVRRGYY